MATSCPTCARLFSKGCLWLPLKDIRNAAGSCLRCRALRDIVEERQLLFSVNYLLKVAPITNQLMYVDLYSWTAPQQPQRHHSFHVFKTEGADSIIHFFPTLGVGRAVAETGGDKTCVDFVKTCLQRCSKHAACGPQTDKMLPKRLVKLHKKKICLMETEGQIGKYAALSYRWGNPKNAIKTTSETLEGHMKEISWETLPRTIKEAIIFTRSIGLEYLWIDALCIIQANGNDDGDWRIEASKMAGYYSNAIITIGASSAASTEEGIFTPREGWLAPRIVQITDSDRRQKQLLVQERPAGMEEFERLNLGPISERGWTFQENVLASRMVHFTATTLMWECKQLWISETGHHELPLERTAERLGLIQELQSLSSANAGHDTWPNYVFWYTRRTLGYHSDRLAAIAGVASWLRDNRSGDFKQYRAGVWETEFANDLSWCLVEREITPIVDSNFPTWSWISVDKGVRFLFPPGSGADGETLCFLGAKEKAVQSAKGLDLVSVLQPELQIQALTRRGHLEHEDSKGNVTKWHNFKISLEGLTGVSAPQEKGPTLSFVPDSHLALVEIKTTDGSVIESVGRSTCSSSFRVEICVVWCGRRTENDSQSRCYYGLVLVPRENKRYIRVGSLTAEIPLEQDNLDLHTQQSLIII